MKVYRVFFNYTDVEGDHYEETLAIMSTEEKAKEVVKYTEEHHYARHLTSFRCLYEEYTLDAFAKYKEGA